MLELCLADVAPVRGDAERVTELLRGDAVRVQERRDGWARIVTAYDYPGWVREEALARRGGDPVAEARACLGAFWLGEGRLLHVTQREGVDGVVEEPEPTDLRPKRRRYVRFPT